MLLQQPLREKTADYFGDGAFGHAGRLRQFDARQGACSSDMLHDPKRTAIVSYVHARLCGVGRKPRQAISSELIPENLMGSSRYAFAIRLFAAVQQPIFHSQVRPVRFADRNVRDWPIAE
jgi:hypothetical protein